MSSKLNTPLTENEIADLDTFLLDSEDDDRLTIDEAHGFLTALIIGRHDLDRELWMQDVWGEPAFEDDRQAEYMTSLLLRMHNEIADTLKSGKRFEPLVVEVEEDGESFIAYEGWCFGFMMGVAQQQDRWDHLPKSQHELLTPISELALVYVEEAPALDEDEYETLTDLIPGSVTSLYNFWSQAGNSIH